MAPDQPDQAVDYLRRDAVATITMRRPALDLASKQALVDAVSMASADDAIRCVVLAGSGRVFCAGQDLKEHAAALDRDASTSLTTIEEHYNPLVESLVAAPKPVIASINGSCAGAGLSLALACDLRIAASGIRFATAFTGIGLTFDSGLSATLARAVGTARASELILLGDPFTAEQALDWGLVGRVVAPEELPAATDELARRVAAGPTRAYAESKRELARSWAAPLPEVLAEEARVQVRLGMTHDHQRAVQSFLSKERPTFTGND